TDVAHWAPCPPHTAPHLPLLGCPETAGGEDCLWYVDRNGSWHPGFDCDFFTFCCGTCHQRYCCRDPLRLLTERQQRHCLAFSPKTIAGIASAVVLFIAIVTTIVCCFMCSCCYLYQRRQHLRTPLQGPRTPVAPPAPFPMDPKAGPVPPQPGFTPMAVYPPAGPAAQYPLYPSGPPVYNPTGEHWGGGTHTRHPPIPPGGTVALRGLTPCPAPPAAPPPYVAVQPSYPGA
uniref:Shisa family member 4 n=3 Tax=Neoaves TaxID=3078114 RepID=A0A663EM10_AQUCH